MPLRFGEPGCQLFGVLHTPRSGNTRNHAVLLCNPFWPEAIRTHRLFRVLADRLARAGFHVLRFDYFGTGDSEGEESDCTLVSWAHDIVDASNLVLRESGLTSTTWIGLRLGATAAARACALGDVPAHLVLWDPVSQGAAYWREIEDAYAALTSDELLGQGPKKNLLNAASENNGGIEIFGSIMSANMLSEIQSISPDNFRIARPIKISVLSESRPQDQEALLNALDANGSSFRHVTLQSNIPWLASDAVNSALVPSASIDAIVQCVEQNA